jgi:tetratricopeptide (TPR) repeat protein
LAVPLNRGQRAEGKIKSIVGGRDLDMNRVTIESRKPVSPILVLTAFVMLSTALPASAAVGGKTPVTAQAIALARTGHSEEAVRLLQDTLAARPSDLDARLALADIYAESGQADKAEQQFRKALSLHPGSLSAEMALGAFYTSAGSFDAAEQTLGDVVRRHPKLIEARARLALVLARERKYREAEANIRLVPPPADPNARVRHFRLAASIHSGLGDSHAAAHAMEEALGVMPADEDLQLITAVAEANAGDWKACIRNAAPLYRKQPALNSGLLLLRAQAASHLDFTSTLQSLRALDLPDDQKLELRIKSAEILAGADQHAEAVEDLQEALKIGNGGDQTLLYNLAVEQYGAQQFDQASATLASLRAQNDSAEIEDLLGDTEEQKGDLSAAIHSHENAIVLAPGEEQYRLSLGAELLKYRAYAPAVTVFQQAAALFPNSARIYVGLGMAYYFMEKYDDSVSAFLRADKLDGRSGRALGYLGATQADSTAGTVPAAVEAICGRAGSKNPEPAMVTWCGALLFRKAYLAGNQSAAPEVISRLRLAAKLSPNDAVANCSLGRALEWTEQLAEARHWLELCIRLRPGSAEDHYRLSRVYQGLGLKQAAAEEADLTDKANAEQDQHQAMADKFAHEMLGQSKSSADPK